jgi:hypothetical protein
MSAMTTIQNDRFRTEIEVKDNRAVAMITTIEGSSSGRDARSFAESMTDIQKRIIEVINQHKISPDYLRLVIETTMLVNVVAKIQPSQLADLKQILASINEIELFADDHKAMAKLMNLLITAFAGPLRDKLFFHGTIESAMQRAWQS